MKTHEKNEAPIITQTKPQRSPNSESPPGFILKKMNRKPVTAQTEKEKDEREREEPKSSRP